VLLLRRPAEHAVKERAFRLATLLSTVVGIVVLAVLVVSILLDGTPFLSGRLFTSYASRFADETGYRAGITGTLSLMVLVALFSFPVGVGAAIYLEEFAPVNRFTRLMEANIANLAGIPSIVYGLLGAAVFVYLIGFGRSLVTGALTLSLLILPVIIVAGREAIRAVPQAIREGGLALGATPWQVVSRQVLPVAMPGILTGTILSLSRAIGETAPLLVAGAVFSRRADNEPWHSLESFTALPIQIYQYVGFPNPEFRVGAASAGIIILMVLLLLMNSVAIVLRNRFSRRL
jgi:phosphate transport system permease protein